MITLTETPILIIIYGLKLKILIRIRKKNLNKLISRMIKIINSKIKIRNKVRK